MRKKIRLLVGVMLLVLNVVIIIYRASIDPFILNVIFASMFTILLYLIYDEKTEKFDGRIKRLKKDFESEVHYDKESERYTYYHFGTRHKRETFMELIKISCLLPTRKAEKIVKHFEKESRGMRK